jgi:hypothetical protein
MLMGASTLLLASLSWAAVDISDIDDDLMRSMDDSIKALEPYLTAHNAKAGVEDAQVLQDGLKWTEQYFAAKGGAEDAVKWAQEGQEHSAAILRSLQANDFDAAIESARATAKTCHACHDAYKPLTK